jgi:hypothetical protein
VPGFIALVVVLSLFILSSLAAVIYLVRTRHPDDNFEDVVFFPSSSARRQRNSSSTTTDTKNSYSGNSTQHTRTGTDESTSTVKAKLASMFRSLGGAGTTRSAGWYRAAEDEDWDDSDPAAAPSMAELGLRRAPSAPVVVHPTARGQHVSESAAEYEQRQHPPTRQPTRRSTADSDDLSETSTIVVRERPVPAAVVNTALARNARNGLHSPTSPLGMVPPSYPPVVRPGPYPGRTPRRMGTGSSTGSSPPGSFYSARMDFTPEHEEPPMQNYEDNSRRNSIQSHTGSRFREII